MDIILLKLTFLILLYAITMVAGFPLYWTKITSKLSNYFSECDAFSRGVFFSIGMVHLLPEAQERFNQIEVFNQYHLHFLIPITCVFSFIFLLWIEKGLPKLFKVAKNSNFIPIVLVFALCLHSFIEGYALGVKESASAAALLFFAIIIHKGIEAMALSFKLYASTLIRKKSIIYFLIFASMTPFGIILGMLSIYFLDPAEDVILSTLSDAVAAGTFIYIGTMHESESDHLENKPFSVWSFIFGLVLMIILIELTCNH